LKFLIFFSWFILLGNGALSCFKKAVSESEFFKNEFAKFEVRGMWRKINNFDKMTILSKKIYLMYQGIYCCSLNVQIVSWSSHFHRCHDVVVQEYVIISKKTIWHRNEKYQQVTKISKQNSHVTQSMKKRVRILKFLLLYFSLLYKRIFWPQWISCRIFVMNL
jgi:hypothetical protein